MLAQPPSHYINYYISMSNMGCRHGKIYDLMREIGKDTFYIELLELYPCNGREELRAREGYYIRERGTLNMVIAGRSQK